MKNCNCEECQFLRQLMQPEGLMKSAGSIGRSKLSAYNGDYT